MFDIADRIDHGRAPGLRRRFSDLVGAGEAAAIATLLGAAYPAMVPVIEADPSWVVALAREGFASARDRATLLRKITTRFGELGDEERVRRELRRAARDERARVALRELLPASLGGADVDVTAAELSALADVTLEIAFAEARFAMEARFGPALAASGAPARFVTLGMGKLGGDELNAGSDVDLIFFYDTDEGGATSPSGAAISLHDFWTRVGRRMTTTLEEPTADGFVWRVDLRLRPEGRSGPVANSLAAADRYYEAFGRLWERAALLRARPCAGDLGFGAEVMASFEPFVWRRTVDPRVAVDMIDLARRARAELSEGGARDLKLGPGGIREAEFFVQSLQLVWGGKNPRVRVRNTLDALRRLRAQGLVGDREFREVAAAYLALRRAEHVVQTATGIQTHALPASADDLARTARALGFDGARAFSQDLARHTRRVATRFASLAPATKEAAADSTWKTTWNDAFAALDRADGDAFVEAIVRAAERAASSPFADDEAEARWRELARQLVELGRHPDAPLGSRTREAMPELGVSLLDAVFDAADPQQAVRFLRRVFSRVRHPGVYAKLLADDRRAIRRLVEALGASAFVGEAVANHPELGDVVMFYRGAPTPGTVREAVASSISEVGAAADDDEVLLGALRRAKATVTIEVVLADLGGELDTRGATLALSELADATLEAAARASLGLAPTAPVEGFAVLAMGKLGGREIGYGSDLDILFLYDPAAAPAGVDPQVHFGRAGRRMMRLIGVSHPAGPGYELDTRLRPSGSQGLLVTSLDSFARYHGAVAHPGRSATVDSALDASPASVHVRAAAWERLALLRARPAAGDPVLGARAMKLAHAAAYDLPFDAQAAREEIARLRTRLEREQSQERRGRYDLKLGKGGLLSLEFAVQLLQLEHGKDRRVRTPETAVAIEALATAGYLAPRRAEALREGHAFLRKLEQRLRVVHANAAQLLEEQAPGLVPLARRMGIRAARAEDAGHELIARYLDVTSRIAEIFAAIVDGR